MPHTQSAKKAVRQTKKRRTLNRSQLSTLKNLVKDFRAAILSKDLPTEEKETKFRFVCRRLDQAGSKHLIHKNAANRTKSRLRRAFNKVLGTVVTAPAQ